VKKSPTQRREGQGTASPEQFSSWIDRLCIQWNCTHSQVWRRFGLTGSLGWEPGRGRPKAFGVALGRADCDRISQATDLSPERVDAMLMTAYHGSVLDLSFIKASGLNPLPRLLAVYGGGKVRLTPSSRRQPVRRSAAWWLSDHSRACPQCLASNGGQWPLWWRLGGATACPDHRTLLHGRCPRCLQPFRNGGRGAPPHADGTRTASSLITCGNRTSDGRICTQRLDELPRWAVPDVVLQVQRLYLRAAAGKQMQIGGLSVPARHWARYFEVVTRIARNAVAAFPELCVMPAGFPFPVHDPAKAAVIYEPGASSTLSLEDGPPPTPEVNAAVMNLLDFLLEPRMKRIDSLVNGMLLEVYERLDGYVSYGLSGTDIDRHEMGKLFWLERAMDRDEATISGLLVDASQAPTQRRGPATRHAEESDEDYASA
jgi:hypothetical protein